jgi:single-strand DNA-binding protein
MRSINKVMLIGNLTRDPELRHTKEGTPVSSFALATSRNWTQETGKKEKKQTFTALLLGANLLSFAKST